MVNPSIAYEISRPVSNTFRKVWIKRKLTSTAKYEANWVEITDYIKRFGDFSISIDDVRINRFTHGPLTLIGKNDEGKFNPESSANSLWYGYLTRYKTLVKVEAGYVQDDGTTLPTDATQGIFILDGEINIDSVNNEATLNCKALSSIFQDVQASDIDGIYSTLTAAGIISLIRDMTDGSSNFIFREVITSTSWTIQSTPSNYYIPNSSYLQNYTVWDFMNLLAQAEGFILLVSRTGGFSFSNRDPNTTASQFSLYGEGYPLPNVKTLDWRKEAVDKYFSVIRLQYLQGDTSTSYVSQGTSTVVDPSNPAWKYGAKTLTIVNTFISDTATAQALANARYADFSSMKQELQVTCRFLPQVDISDRVDLSWTSFALSSRLWDTEDWASDGAVDVMDGLSFDPELGENFDYNAANFKILSKDTNLDDFTTTLVLREI